MAPAFLSTKVEYETLVDKFDTFLFDCDGVIWHGDRLVPGAREVLSILRERSKYSLAIALKRLSVNQGQNAKRLMRVTCFRRETCHLRHE